MSTDPSTYLDEVTQREQAATDGPWVVNGEEEKNFCVTRTGCWVDGLTWVGKQSDAQFIAHARTDVPRLVKALREVTRHVTPFDGGRPGNSYAQGYRDCMGDVLDIITEALGGGE
jgi:hypothetical protein